MGEMGVALLCSMRDTRHSDFPNDECILPVGATERCQPLPLAHVAECIAVHKVSTAVRVCVPYEGTLKDLGYGLEGIVRQPLLVLEDCIYYRCGVVVGVRQVLQKRMDDVRRQLEAEVLAGGHAPEEP